MKVHVIYAKNWGQGVLKTNASAAVRKISFCYEIVFYPLALSLNLTSKYPQTNTLGGHNLNTQRITELESLQK